MHRAGTVQNGLKFTQPRERVAIRARRERDQVLVGVEDQCGGLADGQAETMFGPFVQLNANRTGLGLGLWIVQRAVSAHGGAVQVRNLPGRGCVFVISVPAAPAKAPEQT